MTRLLADDATWAEPAPDLEDLVVAAISAEPRPTTRMGQHPAGARRRWVRPLLTALAAAAVIVVAVFLLATAATRRPARHRRVSGTELAPRRPAGPSSTRTVGLADRAPGQRPPRLDDGRFYEAWLERPKGPSRSAPSTRAGDG